MCTLNTRSLNFTGAAALQRWNIQLAGLQEVRWPDSGTKNVGDTTFSWSGRKDGVALAIHRKRMPTCVSWTPVDDRILSARFRHTAGHITVIVAYHNHHHHRVARPSVTIAVSTS